MVTPVGDELAIYHKDDDDDEDDDDDDDEEDDGDGKEGEGVDSYHMDQKQLMAWKVSAEYTMSPLGSH
jgi:hypothetical protein